MAIKLSALYLAIALVLIAPALASAETVTSDTPSSVEVYEWFTITASYENGTTNICDADCIVSAGWYGSAFMTQVAGCEYEHYMQAPPESGTYDLDINCSKYGHESALEENTIDVEKMESTVSVTLSPSSPSAGQTLIVYATYRSESGSHISGICTGTLRRSGTTVDEFTLNEYTSQYSRYVQVPDEIGSYTVQVTCGSSSLYKTDTDSESFEISKRPSSLAVTVPGIRRFGDNMAVEADYMSGGQHISDATCSASIDGESSQLGNTGSGYRGTVTIPYENKLHILTVQCTSPTYVSGSWTQSFTPSDRISKVNIMSPMSKNYYPTADIKIIVTHTDYATGGIISGSSCSAEVDGAEYALAGSGQYYEAQITQKSLGDHTVNVRCERTYYSEGSAGSTYTVVRIPVEISLIHEKTEYVPGEEVSIAAIVNEGSGGDVPIECSARIDEYDLSFNRLTDSRTLEMEKTGEQYTLNIEDTGSPHRARVTVTCSSDVHETGIAWTEYRVKMLGTQTEQGATIVLAMTTLVLFALLILIRKKLKII